MTLWAIAHYDLHLSSAEFWHSTPRALDALMRQARRAEQRAWQRAAIVAATVANVFRGKGQRALGLDDFMPTSLVTRQRQTWQEQLALVETLNKAFGGRDVRQH